MGDPLGFIQAGGGAGGVGQTPSGRPAQPNPVAGPSFGDVLKENLERVNELQEDATRAIEDLQTGERADVENVLMATAKADMAFQLLQQVRNKVVDAYDQIQQFRV
ncbi:MAG: flagellar hook-basal body complex protein FliE [Planctomycetota bacterium]